VVAPVRETVSQTLASLLIHMPRRSVTHVHSILLQMIRQDFGIIPKAKAKAEIDKSHVWEVRHAGLLGVKYEVAVRTDLFETDHMKMEDDDMGDVGKEVLKGVVDAAILGCVARVLFKSFHAYLMLPPAVWVIETMMFEPWQLLAYYPLQLISLSIYPSPWIAFWSFYGTA
jgi:TATA-binding protein-associated factor